MESLRISRPFDAHVHLREGDILKTVLPYTADVFFSAVAMGNLKEPISTAEQVRVYREQILSALPSGSNFMPIMSVMLQKNMTPEILEQTFEAGAQVLKFIPAATSTNSCASNGVTIPELRNYYPVLAKAADLGMIFSGHWELARDAGNVEIPELERERLAI
ncbi:MAG: dihydroorotase, partial [Patescibacteria group bacterium]|nr:dihydroorotase [Patescibacteria group bacterium]